MREDRPKKLPKRLPDPKPRPEAKPDTEAPPLVPDRRGAIAATKVKHLEKEALVLERSVAVKVFRERFDPFVMELLAYQGGKGNRAPDIASEINKRRDKGQIYLEPFCGGGAVLCKVDDRGPRFASDSFAPLIDLLEAIQEGWTPPKYVSRRDYNQARDDLRDMLGAKSYAEAKRKSDTLKQGELPVEYTWALLAGSYLGEWVNSYAKKGKRPSDKPASTQAYNRLLKRLKEMPGGIENVEFFHLDYRNWLPHDAVIYCDPPYVDVKKYRDGDFDTDEFWDLMNIWRRDNTVLVTEQANTCPLPGAKVLFTYPAGTKKKRTDALYRL